MCKLLVWSFTKVILHCIEKFPEVEYSATAWSVRKNSEYQVTNDYQISCEHIFAKIIYPHDVIVLSLLSTILFSYRKNVSSWDYEMKKLKLENLCKMCHMHKYYEYLSRSFFLIFYLIYIMHAFFPKPFIFSIYFILCYYYRKEIINTCSVPHRVRPILNFPFKPFEIFAI